MSGVKGRSGSGGKRPGAGRPKYRTDAEIRRELQKRIPDALITIDEKLKAKERFDAWKLIDKFVGDKKVTEFENSEKGPLLIRIVEDKPLANE